MFFLRKVKCGFYKEGIYGWSNVLKVVCKVFVLNIFCGETYNETKSSRLFKQDTEVNLISTHFQTGGRFSCWPRTLKLTCRAMGSSMSGPPLTIQSPKNQGLIVSCPELVEVFAKNLESLYLLFGEFWLRISIPDKTHFLLNWIYWWVGQNTYRVVEHPLHSKKCPA